MSEKEIGKPKRKKTVSEPEEKAAAPKTPTRRKTAEKKIQLKDPETVSQPEAAAAAAETTKPVRKARAGKKAPAETLEKIGPVEDSEPEPSVGAGVLAEALKAAEIVKDDSTLDAKPRKRITRAKKMPAAPASDTVIKKTAPKAKPRKTKSPEVEPSAVVETESPAAAPLEAKEKTPAESESAAPAEKKEESPIFKQLAEPELPALPQENRARLQMQSPNRIFLYWSIKHNPFETIQRAFPGRAQNYQLAAKLLDLTNNTEEVFPVGNPSGSWWFNVNSNTAYRVELGFSAPGRPFVRLMYSNTVQTPRSAPSPNTDWATDFTVSADQFAEVLDASGYAQDAFDVAIAGDDKKASDAATEDTFFQLVGGERRFGGDADELRFVLFVLAAGGSLESLRGRIGPGLFAMLEAIFRENAERLSAEKVLAALHENFEFEDEAEELLTPVFGASAINFPKKIRRPKYSPISSLHPVTSR